MERHNGIEPDPAGAFVYHADAQATIAALQKEIATRDSTDSILATRIRELEARLTQRTEQVAALQARVREYREQIELLQGMLVSYRLEVDSLRTQQRGLMSDEPNYTNMIKLELQIADLQSQLTQRTAELEAAQRERDEAAKDRDDWITSWRALQRHNERIEAELERVRGELVEATHNTNVYQSLYSTGCMDRALLENELRDIRTLVLALPKVEGEINERFCTGSYYSSPRDYRTHVTFEAALVALLKHRQGMEG